MRQVVTVPAAGESIPIALTGLSVLIVEAPAYKSAKVAPVLSFNAPGDQLPVKSGYQYPSPDGYFEKISITGTDESSGDELILVSIDFCVQPVIDSNQEFKSIAGATATKAASNAVQTFSNVELADADGNLPKRLYIWVAGGATAGINFAYDADPTQGLNATDAAQWDNDQSNDGTTDHEVQLVPLEIEGIDWIQKFSWIATVADETPNLIWTGEY